MDVDSFFSPEETEMEEDIYCKNNWLLQYKTILNQIKMFMEVLQSSCITNNNKLFLWNKSELIKKSWSILYQ